MTIAEKMADMAYRRWYDENDHGGGLALEEVFVDVIAFVAERGIEEALDAYVDGDHIDVLDDIRKNRWWEEQV